MGFRNPLTSATVVDTGDGAPAGVRIYQSTDGRGNPMGVAEWDDGVAGDAPSTITATSFGALGGGSFAIKAGTFGGHAGPELDLYVDQASGQATTGLTSPGGYIVNGGRLDAAARGWNMPRSANTNNPSDPITAGAGFVFVLGGTIHNVPAGDLLVSGVLTLSAAASTAGFLRAVVNGVNLSGDSRLDLNTNRDPYPFTYVVTSFPGGDFQVSVNVSCVSAQGTTWTAGTNVAVAYLGPRNS